MPAYRLRRFRSALILVPTSAAILVGLLAYCVERLGFPPRALGPYIERRASGHNSVITGIGSWASKILVSLDRGDKESLLLPSLRIGASTKDQPSSDDLRGRQVLVSTPKEVRYALHSAMPGDVIILLPGVYRFSGSALLSTRPGKEEAPITVRSQELGSAILEFDLSEGFFVSAPHWKFENLTIRGVCKEHSHCEHAFHVVGNASHFVARNNIITDFNAHFKINGVNGRYPDNGLIEHNSLSNNSNRNTDNPVTVIDIVGASRWVIRKNLISDFIKAKGNRISYGGFAKGAGSDSIFEQNIVLCEQKLRGAPGQRVGISLGGGGTGPQYCRDGRCITEQDRGIIRSNLIAFCSDDGIYINRSATSKVLQNTLIDTGGIVVRFPESTADVTGNLVDGAIRSRDDGLIRLGDNVETALPLLYSGLHPVRRLFVDALSLDLHWKEDAPNRTWSLPTSPDLCESGTDSSPVYGAFHNFASCFETDE